MGRVEPPVLAARTDPRPRRTRRPSATNGVPGALLLPSARWRHGRGGTADPTGHAVAGRARLPATQPVLRRLGLHRHPPGPLRPQRPATRDRVPPSRYRTTVGGPDPCRHRARPPTGPGSARVAGLREPGADPDR